MIRSLAPNVARVLAKLTPTKRVLCAVVSHSGVGFAVSDAYLSCATPLAEQQVPAPWKALARENDAATLFVLSSRDLFFPDDFASSSAPYEDAVLLAEGARESGAFAAVERLDLRLTPQEILDRATYDPYLWEFLDDDKIGNDLHPSTLAAVALNDVLWSYSGGWPNTFG